MKYTHVGITIPKDTEDTRQGGSKVCRNCGKQFMPPPEKLYFICCSWQCTQAHKTAITAPVEGLDETYLGDPF